MKNNDTPSIERLKELLAKVTTPNPFDWHFPWRVLADGGKPIIAGARSGNLFRGYIATWDEAALIVETINALPHLIATLETLTPSPPLEQPDIGNAVEAGARALEPNLWTGNNGMSDARSSQAVVNARDFARSMARKCIEAALASPPSRPSFDKWDYAAAALADARCAK